MLTGPLEDVYRSMWRSGVQPRTNLSRDTLDRSALRDLDPLTPPDWLFRPKRFRTEVVYSDESSSLKLDFHYATYFVHSKSRIASNAQSYHPFLKYAENA